MEIKNIKEVNYLNLSKKINLIVPAQCAKLGPPVGPILGQVKIKIKDFCTAFNETTLQFKMGLPLRVVVFVYKNKTFDFIINPPSTSFLIQNIIKFNNKKTLSLLDIYKITLIKQFENNNLSLNIIFRNVLATSKNMKIKIS